MKHQESRVVCILGMHRSGTSVITRMVNLLGVYLGKKGDLMPAALDNPEGFWEHIKIVEVHDKILSLLSVAWDVRRPLPDKWWEFADIQPLKQELISIIKNEFSSELLWGWKDPRTCVLLPLWQEIFRELHIEDNYVIPVRNPLDVAASLKKRNGFSYDESLGIWFLHTITSLYLTNNKPRVVIHYDRFLSDCESNLKNICHTLSINWPMNDEELRKGMKEFLKPQLRHSISKDGDVAEGNGIHKLVVQAYRLCLQMINDSEYSNSLECHSKIEKLYFEYMESFSMISSLYKEKKERFTLQVFNPVGSTYSEMNSVKIPVEFSVDFKKHTVPILDFSGSELRIDPTDIPTYIEIQSIELFEVKEDGSIGKRIVNCSKENGFLGLHHSASVINANSQDVLGILCLDHDPQLFLSVNSANIVSSNVSLQIVMKADKQLFFDVYKEVYFKQLSELVKKENIINQQRVEIDEKENIINQQRVEIDEKENIINQQMIEIAEKDSLVIQKEVCINEKEEALKEILASTSWRITRPLREIKDAFRKR